jgi:hypothetical protein
MGAETASKHTTARTLLILALALYVVIGGLADISRLWQPIGWFGTTADGDAVVTHVAAASPAGAAGVRIGDRFDVAGLSPQQRWYLFPENCAPPGASLSVGVIRAGIEHRVTMISVPEPMGVVERTAILTDVAAGILFVLIGTTTMLLRPTAIVSGFYLFCLGSAPFPYRALDGGLTLPYSFIWLAGMMIVWAAALPGLLIFAVRLLQAALTGWRAWAERIAVLSFIALAAIGCGHLVLNYLLGRPAAFLTPWEQGLNLGLTALIIVVLLATYIGAVGRDRQRLRWVVIGIGVALAASYVQSRLSALVATGPALYDAISVIGAAAPIGVAYAILKHRVVNISFVVSRTIVYGTITALLIAVFAFIDWLVGKVLDQSRLAVVAEVIAAIAIGFSLNGVHRQIDRVVDSLLFRSRHAAERTLTRFAAGLPHAASFELVDEMLAEETSAALGLTSAAVFRRSSEHCFDRMAAVGWDGATTTRLTERDRLVLHLEGERQALKLAGVRWNRTDLPAIPAEPALALPIFVRHQLEGIVMLGPHATGEDFDADELQLLTNCAVAAGAAYDHLEADALRRRVDDLQRMLDSRAARLSSTPTSS